MNCIEIENSYDASGLIYMSAYTRALIDIAFDVHIYFWFALCKRREREKMSERRNRGSNVKLRTSGALATQLKRPMKTNDDNRYSIAEMLLLFVFFCHSTHTLTSCLHVVYIFPVLFVIIIFCIVNKKRQFAFIVSLG